MKRRFILVDTENVQNRWFELLRGVREKDKIIVFYTENHSKKLQDYLEVSKGGKRLRWVECISGENALDYQLLGVLSYLIYIHPKAEYIIYSNDKGYQDTVSSWKDKGIRIKLAGFSTERLRETSAEYQEKWGKQESRKRLEGQESSAKWAKQESGAKWVKQEEQKGGIKQERLEKQNGWEGKKGGVRWEENQKRQQAGDENAAKDNGKEGNIGNAGRGKRKKELKRRQRNMSGVDDCVWEIGKSLLFEEKAAYHALLVDILGQEEGRQQYQAIRKSKECQDILKECYLDAPKERAVHLIQVILQSHSLDESHGKAVYQILQKGDLSDLQAVKKSFDSRIGTKAEQQQCYSVMKKHFGLLKEMISKETTSKDRISKDRISKERISLEKDGRL